MRRHGDFGACEDAVQEALLAAAVQWPVDGVPANPRGWLITVASRRLIDLWRSDEARRVREEAVEVEPESEWRRHAGAPVSLLPPVALASLPDRPHAPRGGRSHNG